MLVAGIMPTVGAGAARTPPPRTPEVVRVQLARSGITTGISTVDLQSRRLESLGTQLTTGGRLHSMSRRITPGEARSLRQLVEKAKLRGFSPKPEWFSERRIACGRACLVVAWRDRTLVLAIPPSQVRPRAPASVQQTYKRIDALVEQIVKLEARYAQRSTLSTVKESDPRREKLYRELDTISGKALPERRHGW